MFSESTTPRLSTGEIDAIEEAIATLSAHIESAKYQLLMLIRQFDQAEGWARQGFVSCANFLDYRIGLGKVAAREHVRVARALPELPQTAKAMEHGELSYSKVRALTRVATADNEEDLVSIAKAGTAAHVEKVVRMMRRAEGPADLKSANEDHDARYLQLRWDDDGNLLLSGKLPPELGAVVKKPSTAPWKGIIKSIAVKIVAASMTRQKRSFAGKRKPTGSVWPMPSCR